MNRCEGMSKEQQIKTFEDFLRQLFAEGSREVPFNVNEYGVSVVVQLAEGAKTFVVVGDTVTTVL